MTLTKNDQNHHLTTESFLSDLSNLPSIRLSTLSRSDGSAEYLIIRDRLRTICSINGPFESKHHLNFSDNNSHQISLELNLLLSNSNSSNLGPRTRYLSDLIRSFISPTLLPPYPTHQLSNRLFSLQINLQTISSSPSQLPDSLTISQPSTLNQSQQQQQQQHDDDDVDSCCGSGLMDVQSVDLCERVALINVTSLALMDSGLNLNSVGLAIGVAIIKSYNLRNLERHSSKDNSSMDDDDLSSVIIVDPSASQQALAESVHLLGFHLDGSALELENVSDDKDDDRVTPSIRHLRLIESFGKFDRSRVDEVLRLGYLESLRMYRSIKRLIRSNLKPSQEG
ncbi:expressed protein [Phakopsora pachyrhizi]|uniref:Expressed protein n=1 Tax=Phakopsora pachyrhizi TaxID=170000 RepID=A0AAV0AI53_PHAPC|nr:expressed protein [Phakopsora pachyrhizi]